MASRKILIVTNRVPYPLKDGGNMAMHAMIEGYFNAGWTVYVLAMNTIRHKVPDQKLHTLYKNIYAFEWMDIDNSVHTAGIIKNFLFSRSPEHADRFYKPAFEKKLTEILDDFKPDFIQIESVYLSSYLPAIQAHSDAITILRLHNLEFQIWQSLSRKKDNAFKKYYLHNLSKRLRRYERRAWMQYDLLMPITEKDASNVMILEPIRNMVVAPFSIDVDKVPVHNDERWVGYHIGAMDWLANQDAMHWFLEDIWPKVRRAMPTFEFYFAGRNMPDEFKEERQDGVYCMGEVADANEFIADKKILIVPLRSAGGIRVKILEAMAAGKVIISTSVAIKGIEAKPGEHYLLARKPQDFLKHIKWCLEHKEEANAMAQRCRDLVKKKYDRATVIDNIMEELEYLHEERETLT